MAVHDLTGNTVIATGAGSGLGQVMALSLVSAGANVLALDVDQGRLQDTVSQAAAAAATGRIEPFVCDVRREDQCAAAVEAAITRLGGLHGLINCAGLGMAYLRPDAFAKPPKFWEADPQRWQDMIDVNVRGPFLMARAAMPQLLSQNWGRIVNVTTSFNTMIRVGNMPYGQTKAALEAASHSWAGDLTETKITVNVLVPGGAADTRMVPEDSPYAREQLIRPDVMAAPICWLMSEASNGVNGMRFIGRLWDPTQPWQDAAKAAGAPIAWPELAAAAAAAGQPVPKGRIGL